MVQAQNRQCYSPTLYCLKEVTDHPRFIMGGDCTRVGSWEARFIGGRLWRAAVRVLYLGEWTVECASVCLFNGKLRQNKVEVIPELGSGILALILVPPHYGIGEFTNQARFQ